MANTTTLPLEIYQLLETKLGKKEAVKVSKALENGVETMQKKADELALQKKLEIKDELSKELASKADVASVKSELKSEIALVKIELNAKIDNLDIRLNARMDKLNIKLNFLIILMIIALTLMNPVVAEIIKNLLHL